MDIRPIARDRIPRFRLACDISRCLRRSTSSLSSLLNPFPQSYISDIDKQGSCTSLTIAHSLEHLAAAVVGAITLMSYIIELPVNSSLTHCDTPTLINRLRVVELQRIRADASLRS